MSCASCQSDNQMEVSTEMMIHFCGGENAGDPGVLAFPNAVVCLDCGSSQFAIPEMELRVLNRGISRSVAA